MPTPTLINFSDSTPAADTGYRNAKFRAGNAYPTTVTIDGVLQSVLCRDMSVEYENLFISLGDVPNEYTNAAGKAVAVNNTATGLEFVDFQGGATDFLGLTDTPDVYTNAAGKAVAVNNTASGLEFVDFQGGVTDFLGLTDTPDAYTNCATYAVRVNNTASGLEFVTFPAGVTTFTGLSDTPDTITANQYIKGDSGGTALEFTALPVDVAIYVPGTYGAGAVIDKMNITRTLIFPQNLTGSRATLDLAPSGGAIAFSILKSGGQVGTIDFAQSSQSGTFTFASQQTFTSSDSLAIVSPGSVDPQAAGLAVTFMVGRG